MEESDGRTHIRQQEEVLDPTDDAFQFERPVQGIFCDEDVATFLDSQVPSPEPFTLLP